MMAKKIGNPHMRCVTMASSLSLNELRIFFAAVYVSFSAPEIKPYFWFDMAVSISSPRASSISLRATDAIFFQRSRWGDDSRRLTISVSPSIIFKAK